MWDKIYQAHISLDNNFFFQLFDIVSVASLSRGIYQWMATHPSLNNEKN